MANSEYTRTLTGRHQIFTDEAYINAENVLEVVSQAYIEHLINKDEIEYLYNYYKGDQPILYRTKEVRPEICNRIVENRANQIVSFKTGYLVGEPIQYVSRNVNDSIIENISKLNGWMFSEGKAAKDKELVNWQEICGTSYRYVMPDTFGEEDEAPFEIETLDPRFTFVVYDHSIAPKPILGCCYTTDSNGNVFLHAYSKTDYFEIKGWQTSELVYTSHHTLGAIPIIEYPANTARLGSFEVVLPILDALNLTESDRLDGIDQFIQSLLVFYNCTLGEDEDGNEINPTLIRQNGVLFLKSIGENKADVKEMSEQLNQTQTQTLIDSLESTWLKIVGMPSQGDGNTSESSNNGAVIFKNGWQGAETRAKERELSFIPAEQEMLKLVLRICNRLTDFNLKVSDVTIKFTRRNYADILSKSQVLVSMLQNEKIAPIDAYVVCGLFADPEDATKRGLEWYESNKAKQTPAEPLKENDEVTI